MTGFAVSLAAVRAGYGAREVLHGISLDVAAGESVALLGPNGVGKTTLARLLVGLVRPTAGRVGVGDWTVAAKRPDEMARRVGYAFQHADQQLFARSVREDVAFGPRRLGVPNECDAVLDELGLAAFADTHPYDLPVPLRKLAALAGVLAMRSGVLALDEPTTGLDRALREIVIAALRRRVAGGVTLITISHDLGFVAEVAERVVVLREGVVAADRPARALLRDGPGLEALGLRPPAAAAIGLALGLTGEPVRVAACVEALRRARWTAPAVE